MNTKTAKFSIAILLIAFLAAWTFGQREGTPLRELMVNGVKRTFIVHVPASSATQAPMPLVVVFHGGGGNAASIMRMTGFNEKADKEHFIVVYPNGSGRVENMKLTFNAGGCCAYAMRENVDEEAFVSKLLDALLSEYSIDKRRVYFTGFSNGAMIASYLAAELSDRVAAAAPVSGAIFATSPSPRGKLAVLLIHGTGDTAVPYGGGMSERSVIVQSQSEPYRSVKDEANYWAKNSGCRPEPKSTMKASITIETFTGCSPGADVEVISIKGGLHAWPGGTKGREEADDPSTDLIATDVIWDFFKNHRK